MRINQSQRRNKRKKTIIFEIKDKLQNAQGRMNFSENLTKETLKTEK